MGTLSDRERQVGVQVDAIEKVGVRGEGRTSGKVGGVGKEQ